MADFSFITTPELRQNILSDYQELQSCRKIGAWKAVHVLAGSIVEAVLIDALQADASEPEKALKLDLAALVERAKSELKLPDEAVALTTVIRHYRNLIHPGRLHRLEKIVDKNSADVAASVTEIIVEHIEKVKRQTYKNTAEQVWSRLRCGATTLPLVPHLIEETSPQETERLLTEIIPAWCQEMDPGVGGPESLEHVRRCYRAIFDSATPELRQRVMRHVCSTYRTAEEYAILDYESNLFRGSDLQYLSKNEAKLIKDHLLNRVNARSIHDLSDALKDIGPHLELAEAKRLVMSLVSMPEAGKSGIVNLLLWNLHSELPKETWDEIKASARGSYAEEFLAAEEVPF